MTVIIVMKFLHYLGLFLAGGGGVAGGVIAAAHRKAGTPPSPAVQAASRTLAYIGLAAILLLWGTGLVMAYSIYGGMNIGWAFHMKLLGATILLCVGVGLNIHLSKRSRADMPPDARFMKLLTMVTRGSLVIVLAGIAITTS